MWITRKYFFLSLVLYLHMYISTIAGYIVQIAFTNLWHIEYLATNLYSFDDAHKTKDPRKQ